MTKGPCLLESRPRGERYYAVGRSTESLQSPLDFVSGYGLASASFRAGPTSTPYRRALGCTPRAWERNGVCIDSGDARAGSAESAHRICSRAFNLVLFTPGVGESQRGSPLCPVLFSISCRPRNGERAPTAVAAGPIARNGPPEASRKEFDKLQSARPGFSAKNGPLKSGPFVWLRISPRDR